MTDERRESLRQKEESVARHIRGGASDGCMCEPCMAARDACAVDGKKKNVFKKIGGAIKKAAGQVLSGLGNAIGQAKWGGD